MERTPLDIFNPVPTLTTPAVELDAVGTFMLPEESIVKFPLVGTITLPKVEDVAIGTETVMSPDPKILEPLIVLTLVPDTNFV